MEMVTSEAVTSVLFLSHTLTLLMEEGPKSFNLDKLEVTIFDECKVSYTNHTIPYHFIPYHAIPYHAIT